MTYYKNPNEDFGIMKQMVTIQGKRTSGLTKSKLRVIHNT